MLSSLATSQNSRGMGHVAGASGAFIGLQLERNFPVFPLLVELEHQLPNFLIHLHLIIDSLQLISFALLPYHNWGYVMNGITRALYFFQFPMYDSQVFGGGLGAKSSNEGSDGPNSYAGVFAATTVVVALVLVGLFAMWRNVKTDDKEIEYKVLSTQLAGLFLQNWVYFVASVAFVPIMQNLLSLAFCYYGSGSEGALAGVTASMVQQAASYRSAPSVSGAARGGRGGGGLFSSVPDVLSSGALESFSSSSSFSPSTLKNPSPFAPSPLSSNIALNKELFAPIPSLVINATLARILPPTLIAVNGTLSSSMTLFPAVSALANSYYLTVDASAQTMIFSKFRHLLWFPNYGCGVGGGGLGVFSSFGLAICIVGFFAVFPLAFFMNTVVFDIIPTSSHPLAKAHSTFEGVYMIFKLFACVLMHYFLSIGNAQSTTLLFKGSSTVTSPTGVGYYNQPLSNADGREIPSVMMYYSIFIAITAAGLLCFAMASLSYYKASTNKIRITALALCVFGAILSAISHNPEVGHYFRGEQSLTTLFGDTFTTADTAFSRQRRSSFKNGANFPLTPRQGLFFSNTSLPPVPINPLSGRPYYTTYFRDNTTQTHIDVLIFIVGGLLVALFAWRVLSRWRVSSIFTDAIDELALQGVVTRRRTHFPRRLPVGEDLFEDFENIINDIATTEIPQDIKINAALSTGEDMRDEPIVYHFTVPYVDNIYGSSDVELSTRFLAEFREVTNGQVFTPSMLAYAAKIYCKGIVKYRGTARVRLAFSYFLACYAAKGKTALFQLQALRTQESSLSERYHAWRLYSRLANALHVNESVSLEAYTRAKRRHRDALQYITHFWQILVADDVDRAALSDVTRAVQFAKKEVGEVYVLLLTKFAGHMDLVASFAVFCESMLQNTDATAQTLQCLRELRETKKQNAVRGARIRLAEKETLTQLPVEIVEEEEDAQETESTDSIVAARRALWLAAIFVLALLLGSITVGQIYKGRRAVAYDTMLKCGELRSLAAESVVAAQNVVAAARIKLAEDGTLNIALTEDYTASFVPSTAGSGDVSGSGGGVLSTYDDVQQATTAPLRTTTPPGSGGSTGGTSDEAGGKSATSSAGVKAASSAADLTPAALALLNAKSELLALHDEFRSLHNLLLFTDLRPSSNKHVEFVRMLKFIPLGEVQTLNYWSMGYMASIAIKDLLVNPLNTVVMATSVSAVNVSSSVGGASFPSTTTTHTARRTTAPASSGGGSGGSSSSSTAASFTTESITLANPTNEHKTLKFIILEFPQAVTYAYNRSIDYYSETLIELEWECMVAQLVLLSAVIVLSGIGMLLLVYYDRKIDSIRTDIFSLFTLVPKRVCKRLHRDSRRRVGNLESFFALTTKQKMNFLIGDDHDAAEGGEGPTLGGGGSHPNLARGKDESGNPLVGVGVRSSNTTADALSRLSRGNSNVVFVENSDDKIANGRGLQRGLGRKAAPSSSHFSSDERDDEGEDDDGDEHYPLHVASTVGSPVSVRGVNNSGSGSSGGGGSKMSNFIKMGYINHQYHQKAAESISSDPQGDPAQGSFQYKTNAAVDVSSVGGGVSRSHQLNRAASHQTRLEEANNANLQRARANRAFLADAAFHVESLAGWSVYFVSSIAILVLLILSFTNLGEGISKSVLERPLQSAVKKEHVTINELITAARSFIMTGEREYLNRYVSTIATEPEVEIHRAMMMLDMTAAESLVLRDFIETVDAVKELLRIGVRLAISSYPAPGIQVTLVNTTRASSNGTFSTVNTVYMRSYGAVFPGTDTPQNVRAGLLYSSLANVTWPSEEGLKFIRVAEKLAQIEFRDGLIDGSLVDLKKLPSVQLEIAKQTVFSYCFLAMMSDINTKLRRLQSLEAVESSRITSISRSSNLAIVAACLTAMPVLSIIFIYLRARAIGSMRILGHPLSMAVATAAVVAALACCGLSIAPPVIISQAGFLSAAYNKLHEREAEWYQHVESMINYPRHYLGSRNILWIYLFRGVIGEDPLTDAQISVYGMDPFSAMQSASSSIVREGRRSSSAANGGASGISSPDAGEVDFVWLFNNYAHKICGVGGGNEQGGSVRDEHESDVDEQETSSDGDDASTYLTSILGQGEVDMHDAGEGVRGAASQAGGGGGQQATARFDILTASTTATEKALSIQRAKVQRFQERIRVYKQLSRVTFSLAFTAFSENQTLFPQTDKQRAALAVSDVDFLEDFQWDLQREADYAATMAEYYLTTDVWYSNTSYDKRRLSTEEKLRVAVATCLGPRARDLVTSMRSTIAESFDWLCSVAAETFVAKWQRAQTLLIVAIAFSATSVAVAVVVAIVAFIAYTNRASAPTQQLRSIGNGGGGSGSGNGASKVGMTGGADAEIPPQQNNNPVAAGDAISPSPPSGLDTFRHSSGEGARATAAGSTAAFGAAAAGGAGHHYHSSLGHLHPTLFRSTTFPMLSYVVIISIAVIIIVIVGVRRDVSLDAPLTLSLATERSWLVARSMAYASVVGSDQSQLYRSQERLAELGDLMAVNMPKLYFRDGNVRYFMALTDEKQDRILFARNNYYSLSDGIGGADTAINSFMNNPYVCNVSHGEQLLERVSAGVGLVFGDTWLRLTKQMASALPSQLANILVQMEYYYKALMLGLSISTSRFAEHVTERQNLWDSVILALTIVLIVLVVFHHAVIVSRYISFLRLEESSARLMLRLIPIEARESNPHMAAFIESGKLLGASGSGGASGIGGGSASAAVRFAAIEAAAAASSSTRQRLGGASSWSGTAPSPGGGGGFPFKNNNNSGNISTSFSGRGIGGVGSYSSLATSINSGGFSAGGFGAVSSASYASVQANMATKIDPAVLAGFPLGFQISALSTQPVVTIDQQGIISRFTSAAETVFGYTAQEAIGRNVSMLMPPEYANVHDSFLANYRRTKIPRVIGHVTRVKGMRKNGSIFPFELTVKEIVVSDDERYFVGIGKDLSTHMELALQGRLNDYLLDLTSDCVVIIDSYGYIRLVNKSVQHVFGYSPSELIGENCKVLMSPMDAQEHDGYLKRYRETGVRHIIDASRDVFAQRKNGEIFSISLSVRELKGTMRGEPSQFIGFIRDVSENVVLEEQSHANDVLCAISPTPLMTLSHTGVFLKFSTAAENLFGYTADELVRCGMNIKMLIDNNDHESTQLIRDFLTLSSPIRSPLAKDEGPLDGEQQQRRKDRLDLTRPRNIVAVKKSGERVPIRLSAMRVAHENAESVLLISATDITQIQKAESQLQLLEAMREWSVIPIVGTDANGTITSFNDAAVHTFGYSPSEVIGKNCSVLMPPEVRAHHNEVMAAFAASRGGGSNYNISIVGQLRKHAMNAEGQNAGSYNNQNNPVRKNTNSSSSPLFRSQLNSSNTTDYFGAGGGPHQQDQQPSQSQQPLLSDFVRNETALRKDNTTFPVKITLREFRDPLTLRSEIFAFIEDVTETRSTAQKLMVNEALLSLSPIPIIAIDGDGRIDLFSAAAETCFGYSSIEVIGRNISIIMPPEVRSRHDSFLQTFHRTGNKVAIDRTLTVTAMRRNGSRFPCEVSVREVKHYEISTLGGLVTGGATTTSDRLRAKAEVAKRETEREGASNKKGKGAGDDERRSRSPTAKGQGQPENKAGFVAYLKEMSHEGQLLEARALGATVATLSPTPIIRSTVKGIITYANPAACREFRFELHELLGKNVKVLMDATIADRHDSLMSAYERRRSEAKRAFEAFMRNPEHHSGDHAALTADWLAFQEQQRVAAAALGDPYYLSPQQQQQQQQQYLAAGGGIASNGRLSSAFAAPRHSLATLAMARSARLSRTWNDEGAVGSGAQGGYEYGYNNNVQMSSNSYVGSNLFTTQSLPAFNNSEGMGGRASRAPSIMTQQQQQQQQRAASFAAVGTSSMYTNNTNHSNTGSMPPPVTDRQWREAGESTWLEVDIFRRVIKSSARRSDNSRFEVEISLSEVPFLTQHEQEGLVAAKGAVNGVGKPIVVKQTTITTTSPSSAARTQQQSSGVVGGTNKPDGGNQLGVASGGGNLRRPRGSIMTPSGDIDRDSIIPLVNVGSKVGGGSLGSEQSSSTNGSAHAPSVLSRANQQQQQRSNSNRSALAHQQQNTGNNNNASSTADFANSVELLAYVRNLDLQRRLEKANEAVDVIVNMSIVPIIAIDSQGVVIIYSSAAEQAFEFRSEEVLGKNIKMLMPPEVAEKHDSYLRTYLRTNIKTVVGNVLRHEGQRRSGSRFPVEISVKEILKPSQSPLFIAYLRPVANDTALEQATQLSQSIIAYSPIPVVVINRKGIIRTFNEAATHLTGYEQEEVVGLNVALLMEDEDARYHDRYLKLYAQNGIKTAVDATKQRTLKTRDGRIIETAITVKEVIRASKEVLFIGFIRDMTRELDLQSTSIVNDVVADLSPIPLICINEKGIVIEFNAAAERDFRYSANEVIGQNVKILMMEDTSKKHDAYLTRFVMNRAQQMQQAMAMERANPQQLVSLMDPNGNDFVGYGQNNTMAQNTGNTSPSGGRMAMAAAAGDFFHTSYTSTTNHNNNVCNFSPPPLEFKRLDYGRRRTGEHFPIEIVVREVKGVKGRLLGKDDGGGAAVTTASAGGTGGSSVFVGFIRDLTAHFETEHYKSLYETVVHISPFPIVSIQPDGTIIAFNSAASEAFKYEFDEVHGKNVRMLMPKEVADKHDMYLARYLKTGVKTILDQTREVYAKNKAGRKFPAKILIKEIKEEDRHYFIANLTDISVTTALEHAWNLNDCIIDMSDTAIACTDPNGIITKFSRVACEVFKCKESDVLGKDLGLLMTEGWRQLWSSSFIAWFSHHAAQAATTLPFVGIADESGEADTQRESGNTLYGGGNSWSTATNEAGGPLRSGKHHASPNFAPNFTTNLQSFATAPHQRRSNATNSSNVNDFRFHDQNQPTSAAGQYGLNGEHTANPNGLAHINNNSETDNLLAVAPRTLSQTLRCRRSDDTEFTALITVNEIPRDKQDLNDDPLCVMTAGSRQKAQALSDRNIGGFVVSISNYTEEAQGAEEDAVLFAAEELAQRSLIVVNGNGLIVRLNTACATLFGYASKQSLIGKNVRILMPPDAAAAHDNAMRRYLKTGHSHIMGVPRLVLARMSSGQHIQVELLVTRIHNPAVNDLSTRNTRGKGGGMGSNNASGTEHPLPSQHGHDNDVSTSTNGNNNTTSTTKRTGSFHLSSASTAAVDYYQDEEEDPANVLLLGVIENMHVKEELSYAPLLGPLALDASPTPLAVINRDGIIIEINDSALGVFDFTREQSVGKNIGIFMPSGFQKQHDRYLAKYIATGEKRVVDGTIFTTGETRSGDPISLKVSVREFQRNQQTYFIGALVPQQQVPSPRLHQTSFSSNNKSAEPKDVSSAALFMPIGSASMPQQQQQLSHQQGQGASPSAPTQRQMQQQYNMASSPTGAGAGGVRASYPASALPPQQTLGNDSTIKSQPQDQQREERGLQNSSNIPFTVYVGGDKANSATSGKDNNSIRPAFLRGAASAAVGGGKPSSKNKRSQSSSVSNSGGRKVTPIEDDTQRKVGEVENRGQRQHFDPSYVTSASPSSPSSPRPASPGHVVDVDEIFTNAPPANVIASLLVTTPPAEQQPSSRAKRPASSRSVRDKEKEQNKIK